MGSHLQNHLKAIRLDNQHSHQIKTGRQK